MKVFLVEDSLAIRERLAELIRDEGHEVVGEAADEGCALAGLAATNPDVAIFDVELKRGNGISALASIKTQQPHLVGIVMTNQPNAERRHASEQAGAAYFLDKSSEFERIAQILSLLDGAAPQPPA